MPIFIRNLQIESIKLRLVGILVLFDDKIFVKRGLQRLGWPYFTHFEHNQSSPLAGLIKWSKKYILGLLDIVYGCTLSQLPNLLLCQFIKLPNDQNLICGFNVKKGTLTSICFHTYIYVQCTLYLCAVP